MEKKGLYLAPEISIFGVAVEDGFAASIPNSSTESFGSGNSFEDDWDMD